MKKVITLFFVTFAFINMKAQISNFSTSESKDSFFINEPANVDVMKKEIEVKNTGNIKRFFSWQRTVVTMTPDWSTLVCDPEACWAPVRTESDFDLEANESGPFYLDVFPEGKVGTAYIKVKMFEVGKPANFITLRYRFNGQVVGVEEIEATKLRLFPNPTADYFVLEGYAPLTTVDVLSVTGQVLKTFPYVANEIYEIEDLTAGTYFLNLNGENNKRLATKRLIKQ